MATSSWKTEYIRKIQNKINSSTDSKEIWISDDVYFYFGCKYTKRSVIAWRQRDKGYDTFWKKSDIERFRLEAPTFCNDFERKYKERKREYLELKMQTKNITEVWGEIHNEFPNVSDDVIRSIGRELNVYETNTHRQMWSETDIAKLKRELYKRKNSTHEFKYSKEDYGWNLKNRKTTFEVQNEILNSFPNTSLNEIRKIGHNNHVTKMMGNNFMWSDSDIEKLKNDLNQKEIERKQRKRIRILATLLPYSIVLLFLLIFLANC